MAANRRLSRFTGFGETTVVITTSYKLAVTGNLFTVIAITMLDYGGKIQYSNRILMCSIKMLRFSTSRVLLVNYYV